MVYGRVAARTAFRWFLIFGLSGSDVYFEPGEQPDPNKGDVVLPNAKPAYRCPECQLLLIEGSIPLRAEQAKPWPGKYC